MTGQRSHPSGQRSASCRAWQAGVAWSLAAGTVLLRGRPSAFQCQPLPRASHSKGLKAWDSGREARPERQLGLSFKHVRPAKKLLQHHSKSRVALDAGKAEDGAAEASGETTAVAVHSASRGALVVNLVKNLIGAGILSLPGGVAAVSAAPEAAVPATIIAIFVAGLCTYTFSLIARVLSMTKTDSVRDAWERAIGPNNGWLVSGSVTVKTGLSCLVYTMVLGDAGSSLALASGVPASIAARTPMILIIAVTLLLPMSFLESLEVLKYTSFLGLTGIVYTIGIMALRLKQGAYAPGGEFYSQIAPAMRPSWSTAGSWLSTQAFVFVACLAFAFTVHYNATKFYVEADRDVKRYNFVAIFGFIGCSVLCLALMLCGFLTFGGAAQGLILNNYAAADRLMAVARAGISLNILCTYPLLFLSYRNGIQELWTASGRKRLPKTRLTLVLLTTSTIMSVILKDLGPVAAIGGAVFGSAINFLFPCIIFLGATKDKARAGSSRLLRLERLGARFLVCFGVSLAILGTVTSLR